MRNLKARPWRSTITALVVLAGILLVGCGSGSDSDSGRSQADAGSGPGGLIIEVNCPVSICGAMKLGSEEAAKQAGVNYQWNAPSDLKNFVSDYTTLVQRAIDRHPDALILGTYVPAVRPLIKRAARSGMPVVVLDSGVDTWQEDGALGFAGFSYEVLGTNSGEEFVRQGVRHFLCINPAADNPNVGVVCRRAGAAVTASGGTFKEVLIPLADNGNHQVVQQDVQGFLAANPETDGILAATGAVTTDVVAAVKAAGKGGEIKIGAQGVTKAGLDEIKAGDLAFVVDIAQYLSGSYAMQMAAQYLKYHLSPSGPIITGGTVVNKANVDAFVETQSKYPGIFGAG